MIDSVGAWSAGIQDENQWLQIDLLTIGQVAGITTQPRDSKYVKSYKVQVSLDGTVFDNVDGGHIFNGNMNGGETKITTFL